MKEKMKKSVLVLLVMCMVLGQGTVYLAASGGLDWSATKERIFASYTNGKPVSLLRIELAYTEIHRTTGDDENDVARGVATGGCTSVSASKVADEGYDFTIVHLTNYVDGVKNIDRMELTVN